MCKIKNSKIIRKRINTKVIFINPLVPAWIVIDDENMAFYFDIYFKTEQYDIFHNIVIKKNKNLPADAIGIIYDKITKILDSKKFFSEPHIDEFYLNSIVINVTNKCNLNCIYCFNNSNNSYNTKKLENEDFMSEALFKRICQNISSIPSRHSIPKIYLSGGEPLLHPNILKFIRIAKSYNFFLGIVTNGLLLSTKKIDIVDSLGIDEIRISIDGTSAKVNDLQRGKTFNKILQIIKNIHIKKRNCKFTLSSTISNINIKDIKNIPYFANSFGCQYNFSFLKPSGNGRNITLDYNKLITELKRTNWQSHIVQSGQKNISCGIAKRTLCIDPIGNIYPCAQLSSSKSGIGRLSIKSNDKYLFNVLNTNIFNKDIHVDNIPECSACEIRYICGGGCRVIAQSETGSFLGHGSDCELRKYEIYSSILSA